MPASTRRGRRGPALRTESFKYLRAMACAKAPSFKRTNHQNGPVCERTELQSGRPSTEPASNEPASNNPTFKRNRFKQPTFKPTGLVVIKLRRAGALYRADAASAPRIGRRSPHAKRATGPRDAAGAHRHNRSKAQPHDAQDIARNRTSRAIPVRITRFERVSFCICSLCPTISNKASFFHAFGELGAWGRRTVRTAHGPFCAR